MLNRRLTITALIAGLGLLVAAFAFGLFRPDLPPGPWTSAPSKARSTQPVSPLARSWSPLSINRHIAIDLRMAPMHGLDKTAIARDQAQKDRTAQTAKHKKYEAPQLKSPASVPPIQRPLDLSLPSLRLPTIAAMPTPAESSSNSTRSAASSRDSGQPTLDLNAGLGTPEFEADRTNKLFNRDSGLRGFMKQSWINQNLGFQGGLAIKPERLRETDSDLSDNMAVGMGVLLAF